MHAAQPTHLPILKQLRLLAALEDGGAKGRLVQRIPSLRSRGSCCCIGGRHGAGGLQAVERCRRSGQAAACGGGSGGGRVRHATVRMHVETSAARLELLTVKLLRTAQPGDR